MFACLLLLKLETIHYIKNYLFQYKQYNFNSLSLNVTNKLHAYVNLLEKVELNLTKKNNKSIYFNKKK